MELEDRQQFHWPIILDMSDMKGRVDLCRQTFVLVMEMASAARLPIMLSLTLDSGI
jgi:hypothetical protein